MIRILEYLKAQGQIIPQKRENLRSLPDRVFVISNHVAVTPAIHVIMRASPRLRNLLRQKHKYRKFYLVALNAEFEDVVLLHVQFHVVVQKVNFINSSQNFPFFRFLR